MAMLVSTDLGLVGHAGIEKTGGMIATRQQDGVKNTTGCHQEPNRWYHGEVHSHELRRLGRPRGYGYAWAFPMCQKRVVLSLGW
jgi:hypothetical protein